MSTDVRRQPALRIELIGHDLVGVTAEGRFEADCEDFVARRLDVLVSAGAIRLHIDFGAVEALDDRVATVFVDAAAHLDDAGGRLVVTAADSAIASTLRSAASSVPDGSSAVEHVLPPGGVPNPSPGPGSPSAAARVPAEGDPRSDQDRVQGGPASSTHTTGGRNRGRHAIR